MAVDYLSALNVGVVSTLHKSLMPSLMLSAFRKKM